MQRLLYKLFAQMVMARLKDRLLEQQSVDQAGFRPGSSTEDNLFALEMLMERTGEWRQNLWLVAIDF
jgi:hypothetical protein